MHALKIFLRITKFLGKAILGLLFILIAAIAIIHIPSVQELITRKLSNYLSSKIEAKVDIQRVKFSLLGSVSIEDLTVWDPHQNKILSAHKIEVTSNIFDLVTGDLIFDEVHLAGIDGKLIQSKDGLNIQFIIDAFKSKKQSDATKSNPVNLKFKEILLENIVFEFSSMINGITVATTLGRFASHEAEFSTKPTKIKAGQIILEQTVVNTLSTQPAETNNASVTSKNKKTLSPDFGTGILFEIGNVEFRNNDVSFHRYEVMDVPKFDPAHINLKNLQISLSYILMSEDTMAAALESLSVQLPGFTLANAKADFQLNRKQMVLSGLRLASGTNEVHADVSAPYALKSAEDTVQAHGEIAFRAKINPNDLAYFFSDSVINQFIQWGPSAFALEGNYTRGTGKIKTLNLKTGNSQVQVEGMLHDVLHRNKISWGDLVINASIGQDFKRTLTPFLRNINVPPDVRIQLKSSGSPKQIFADTKIFTKWGNVIAAGRVSRKPNNMDIDLNLTGEKVDLGAWLNQSSLGLLDLSIRAKGIIGEDQNIEVNGLINNVELRDQTIHQITFQSTTIKNNSSVLISIADPNFRSEIASEISFGGPLMLTNDIHFADFRLGLLLQRDTTLIISGDTKSKITIDQSSLEGYAGGRDISFHNRSMKYSLDTLYAHALISPTASDLEYFTKLAKAKLVSNFDIRNSSEVIEMWSQNILEGPDNSIQSKRNRTAHFNIELDDASVIKLLGVDIDEFSSFRITGEFDENKQSATLQGASGKFRGYGISLDTLNTSLKVHQDNINASMRVHELLYDSIQLGNLDFDVLTDGDTAITNLLLANDTMNLLGMRARILTTDSGRLVYPNKLIAFNNNYSIDPGNPVRIKNKSLTFNHFMISRDDMQINLDGNLNYFDVSFKNLDLTPLNFLLSNDTTIINEGRLSGAVSYSRDQQLHLKANIDSLRLYNSNPLTVAATAVTDENKVPFEFLLTNETNKIDLKGRYFSDNKEVDAFLLLDLNNPEIFQFLVSGIFEEFKGSVKGKTTIRGPIQKPAFKGSLRFLDMGLTTANPRISINVEDDSIVLDNTALRFNNFTLHDKDNHPLTIAGNIDLHDYQSLAYDLQINSDGFSLINNPDSTSGRLRGKLLIDSDIKLKGSEKDTNIEAKITIKDATDLTFVTSRGDIELIKAEGIVDFVDPALLLDSALASGSYYDSLIASLPEFDLKSTIVIEDSAAFRVIIDEQSGDYITASGRADLEMEYNRTGNLSLAGNYTINKGVYRLSFYDLVKKNFELVQGSSINWSGSPENGDLNIKARYTVESNSIGLIGHEIGENEKSIYKRSLDYEVGINIGGTVERPVISFSLDLPQDDKVSYPALANKLDRLRQPEYQSELNKQVFGLLVLGGFLPETNSANANSNLIATTALSNSVNALLASQLNRFASQYVKGVNIDVGIQSYSDYSAPGGKTQTAMDFRVSKSLMNDRLSFEIGGDFDINQDQSGAKTGKNYRGDIAIIYDLTGNGDKKLKLFNNETYDIVYQEIRNTGISIIFIREFDRKDKNKYSIETANKNK